MAFGENMEKKEKSSNLIGSIIGIVIGAAFGFCLISFSGGFFKEYNTTEKFLALVLLLISLFLSALINIIAHETGHLIAGLISGYTFTSFRIGSFIWIKQNNKLALKRFSLKGTAGQCLMMPPDIDEDRIPYRFYFANGALINLLLSLIAILAAVLLRNVPLASMCFIIFTFVGLFMFFTNILPVRFGAIPNDGCNIRAMGKDPKAKHGALTNLRMNSYMTKNIRIKDFPPDVFKIDSDGETKIYCNIPRTLNGDYFLDKMEFDNARTEYETIIAEKDSLFPALEQAVNERLLLIELLNDCRKEKIEELYTLQMQAVLNAKSYSIPKKLLQFAYASLYLKNDFLTRTYLKEYQKLTMTSPYLSEISSCNEQMEYINRLASDRYGQKTADA